MTRSPSSKRVTPRPSPTTSPASSRPGMSGVEPGGAHADEQLAALRLWIGVLLDRDPAVADGRGAHGRDACTPRRAHAPWRGLQRVRPGIGRKYWADRP